MTYRSSQLSAVALLGILFSSQGLSQESPQATDAQQQAVLKLAGEVHKQIARLPQYGVFDNIYFGIKGTSVTLYGKASRPTLKSSAENVVKKIEGVNTVTNQIDVLPLSPNDDMVRSAVYASIYRYGPLQRYSAGRGRLGPGRSVARMAGGITNDPPIGWHAIHIIVENGNVTLTGVVTSAGDLAMAEMRANSVGGVFSVTNELNVSGKE